MRKDVLCLAGFIFKEFIPLGERCAITAKNFGNHLCKKEVIE